MKKLILALMAVFLMSGVAMAATTLEIKGQFKVLPEWNNFGRGAGVLPNYFRGPLTPGGGGVATVPGIPSSGNVFTDQRARLYFNVKSNENLGGTVALEMDSYWGNTSYDNGRNTGGGLGADSTNLELKNSYMWFKMGELKITGGIQTWGDDMVGIFAGGADMAGFRADYGLSKSSSLSTGVFTWWQRQFSSSTATTPMKNAWQDSVYFIPVTFKQQLGSGSLSLFAYTIQDSSHYQAIAATNLGRRPNPNPAAPGTNFATTSAVGANYDTADLYYTGLNYGGKVGNVSYYLMGAYNFGTFKSVGSLGAATNFDAKVSAFAANAKVDVKIGDGKLRINGLYVSGEDSSDKTKFKGFVTADQYAGANTMTLLQDDLVIVLNNTDAISNVTVLANDVNNNGDGVQIAYGAYDYNLSPKLNAKAVVGYAAADKQGDTTRRGKSMGTEYNVQLRYKFDENLTIAGIGSYAKIGDYFKYDATTTTAAFEPDNAYKILLKFMYSF